MRGFDLEHHAPEPGYLVIPFRKKVLEMVVGDDKNHVKIAPCILGAATERSKQPTCLNSVVCFDLLCQR